MRKKNIAILLASTVLSIGGLVSVTSCDTESSTKLVYEISFEKDTYEVESGDKVTITQNVEGVKYRLLEPIEGVTLNEDTGEFTFDSEKAYYPDGYLIAEVGDLEPAKTVVTFVTHPVLPTVTITNTSKYVVDGEYINATSLTPAGDTFAIEYTLKNLVPGVSIDFESGKVTFTDVVKNETRFTVVATSKGVSAEKEFCALTEHMVFAKTEKQVVEANKRTPVKFELDFNGNTGGDAETTAENAQILLNGKIVEDRNLFSYNQEKKTVTISKELIDTLPVGEADIKFVTQRNTVQLNLIVATKIIYEATDFATCFGMDFDAYIKDGTSSPVYNEEGLKGYYVLGQDIDLTDLYKVNANWEKYGFLPIGYRSEGPKGEILFEHPFSGTFDGNGHTISNYNMKHKDDHFWAAGMFGVNTGTIKNFTLEGTVDAFKSWSGIICSKNMGIIENIISKVNIPGQEGFSATGLVAVNNNIVRNVVQLDSRVYANNNGTKNGGYIVGLNGPTGQVENVYAVASTAPNENWKPKALIGENMNINVVEPGHIFESLENLKAFDFKGKLSDEFIKLPNQEPELKVRFTSGSLANFAVVPEKVFGLKGDIIPLHIKIAPATLAPEVSKTIVYEVPENKGVKIVDNKLDLTDLNVAPEGEELTFKAHVTYDDVQYDTTFKLKVYLEIKSVELVNNITEVVTGEAYNLDLVSDPATEIEGATYKFDLGLTGWKNTYAKKWTYFDTAANTIKLDDYVKFLGAKNLKITINALGKVITKDIPIVTAEPLNDGNTSLKYDGENSDFELPTTGLTIKEIKVDGKVLENNQYTNADGKLSIKRDVVEDFEIMHEVLIKTEDGKAFRAYLEATKTVRHDTAWVEANDANAIHIKSVEEFKQYFVVDGKELDATMTANLAKSYILDADLDFAAEKNLRPLTYNNNGAEKHFTGKIYGNGHKILNYNIDMPAAYWGNGLFTHLGGEIYDLTLENCSVKQTKGGNFTGLLGGIGLGTPSPVLVNVHSINCQVTHGDQSSVFNDGIACGGIVGKCFNPEALTKFTCVTSLGYTKNLVTF